MAPVSIFVVHIQNFCFSVTTSLTHATPFFYQTQLEHPLRLYFVLTWTTDLIQITNPAFIRTSPTTSFFICARKDRCSAHPTGNFFSIVLPVTFQATEYPPLTQLNRPAIDRNTTDRACSIWIPCILLRHPTSLPQTKQLNCLCSLYTIQIPRSDCNEAIFEQHNTGHKIP